MREEREWTQGKLGEISGKPRNVISRLENPNYGALTLKTLLEMASAFEVALLVRFVPFSRLLREYSDTSTSALSASSVFNETRQLKRWAQILDASHANASQVEGQQLTLPLLDKPWDGRATASDDTSSSGKLLLFRSHRSQSSISTFDKKVEPNPEYPKGNELVACSGG
jgi:transcriptional regulator with XRE-family HTH domain